MYKKNFIDLQKNPQNKTLDLITPGRRVRTTYELYIRDQCTETNKMVYSLWIEFGMVKIRYASQNLDMQKINT